MTPNNEKGRIIREDISDERLFGISSNLHIVHEGGDDESEFRAIVKRDRSPDVSEVYEVLLLSGRYPRACPRPHRSTCRGRNQRHGPRRGPWFPENDEIRRPQVLVRRHHSLLRDEKVRGSVPSLTRRILTLTSGAGRWRPRKMLVST